MGPLPDFVGELGVIGGKIIGRQVVQVLRLGSGKQCCSFINLIEGVGYHHRGARFAAIDDGMCEGVERLATAVDRNDLGVGVDLVEAIPMFKPVCDGDAQSGRAQSGRISRQAVEIIDERLTDKLWRRVLGFANVEADGLVLRVGLGAFQQGIQFLKWVTLQPVEIWIHARSGFGQSRHYTGAARGYAACSLRRWR